MNLDGFEKRLQRQPVRQAPAEWREEVLLAARQAAPPHHATRNTQHGTPSLLSTVRYQLSTLLWPHPTAWAGLAAVWLVIAGLNHTTHDASSLVAKRLPPSPQVFLAFQEQERLLAEILGPCEAPVAERPKPAVPRPRSERRRELLMA